MREIRTSGSVGGRAGNRPVYPTTVTVCARLSLGKGDEMA